MQGRRVFPDKDGHLRILPGEYGRHPSDGHWYACAPDTDLLGNLGAHKVVEHDDGTITVSPSILVEGVDALGSPMSWHGFLEKGVWRKV